jgi:hypothetical protein
LLSRVLRERIISSAQAALIAVAGTVGAVAGIGLRDGVPSRPFNAFASAVLGARADGVWGFDPRVTLAGMLLLAIAVLVIGFLFALTVPARGAGLLLAAGVVSIAAYALTRLVASSVMQPALSTGLTAPQLGLVCVVLAISLAAGTRLAR